MDNYRDDQYYSCCFMCRRSLAPDIDNNEATGSRFFELLYPGQVFDYFCQLFHMPWLKRHPEGYRIENEEFCQLCAIQIKDAMTTSENLRLLQLKIQSIHTLFKGIIQENYQTELINASRHISRNKSVNFGRLLVQCWSGCKVVVEPLKDQVLPMSSSSSLIKSDPHQDWMCIKPDQLCDHVKTPEESLNLKIPQSSLECGSTGDEPQTVANVPCFQGPDKSQNLECTLGKAGNEQWIQNLAQLNPSADPMDTEMCEKSQDSPCSFASSCRSSQPEPETLEFHSCEDSPDFQSSLSSEQQLSSLSSDQQEMSTDFDSSSATVSPDFQSLQTPPHDEPPEKSQDFLLSDESQDFSLPDKSKETDCKESLDFQLAHEFMNVKSLEKSSDFHTLEDLLNVKPLEVSSDLKLSEQLCSEELSTADIESEKSTSVPTPEGPVVSSQPAAQLLPAGDFTEISVENATIDAVTSESSEGVDAPEVKSIASQHVQLANHVPENVPVLPTDLEFQGNSSPIFYLIPVTSEDGSVNHQLVLPFSINLPTTTQDVSLDCSNLNEFDPPKSAEILSQVRSDIPSQVATEISSQVPASVSSGILASVPVLPSASPQIALTVPVPARIPSQKPTSASSEIPSSGLVPTSVPVPPLVPVPPSVPPPETEWSNLLQPSECLRCGLNFKDCQTSNLHEFKINHELECSRNAPITESPGPSARFQCSVCDKVYMRKSALLAHSRRSHQLNPPSVCRCGLDLRSVLNNGHFKCNLEGCEHLTFTSVSELWSHHQPECNQRRKCRRKKTLPVLKCTHCDLSFNKHCFLVVHLRSAHGIGDEDRLKCSRCGLNYKECQSSTEPIQFKCSFVACHKTFDKLSQLRKHHLRKCGGISTGFSCIDCDQVFSTKTGLSLHQKKAHGHKKMAEAHACQTCGKSYKKMLDLKRHILSVHEKKFEFLCRICDAGFNHAYRFRNHMQYKHEKVKKFKCEQCESAFISPGQLIYHKRKHTGEKDYICEACGKSFWSLPKLTQHRESIHEKVPVPCPQCHKIFKSIHHVRSHVGRTHKGLWRKWMSNRRAKLEKIQEDDMSFDVKLSSSTTGAKSDTNGKNSQFFIQNVNQVKNEKFEDGDDGMGISKSASASPTSATASSTPYIDVGLLLQNSTMDVGVVEVEIPSDQF